MEADKQGVDALENKLAAMEGHLRDIRTDVSWSKKNSYNISNFAAGSDDKKLDVPAEPIPSI